MHSATTKMKSTRDPNRGLLRSASHLYIPAVNYAAKLDWWCLPDHDEAMMEKEDAIEDYHQDHNSVPFEYTEYEYEASEGWYMEKKS